jgi:hypothetical protein
LSEDGQENLGIGFFGRIEVNREKEDSSKRLIVDGSAIANP